MMRFVVRAVAAVAGAVVGFFAGSWTGCWVYESSGPEYAQCGYEFEGFGHAIVGMIGGALMLGFVAQWLAGLALRARDRR